MAGEIIIPAWNERALNAELDSPDVNVMAMLGGADHKKIEEALGPSAMEAARKTLTKMNREKKRPPVYASDTRPATGYMPGDEEDIRTRIRKHPNPYTRWWRKAEQTMGYYTDIGNPLGLWRPILYGLGADVLKNLEMPIEERDTLLEKTIQGIVSGFRTSFELKQHNLPYEITPALRYYMSLAEGASEINHVYLYEKNSREYPIFITREDEKEPEEAVLRERIKHIDDNDRSPYKDPKLDLERNISGMFDSEDGPIILKGCTFSDYESYFEQEPDMAHGAAVEYDISLTRNHGERQTDIEALLPADLQGKVTIYKRPVSKTGLTYLFGKYVMGDESPRSGLMLRKWGLNVPIVYGFYDFLIEPLEVMMERILPDVGMRHIVEAKQRSIYDICRGPAPLYWKKPGL